MDQARQNADKHRQSTQALHVETSSGLEKRCGFGRRWKQAAQAHKHTSTQAHKHRSTKGQAPKQKYTSTKAQAQKHSSSGLEKRCGFGRRWEETTQRGHNYFASAPTPAATSNFCKNKRISQNNRHCLQSALNPNAWTRLPM